MNDTKPVLSIGQLDLVDRDPASRLIINAGPGTGKTECACARVAFLSDQKGITPSSILLVSFTRTAVKEIRDRLLQAIGMRADQVIIATLDSQAFQLVQGFSPNDAEKVFINYDQTIDSALRLIELRGQDVLEFLEGIEHLIIDEAQDVVGLRSRFLLALIKAIPATAGVTILTDDAQAIYGFSLEENEMVKSADTTTLPQLVRRECPEVFEEAHLTTVHRTSSPSLLKIFRDTRRVVLDDTIPGARKLSQVRDEIEKYADNKIGELNVSMLKGQEDLLILFRRRAEVLTASSFFSAEAIPHRIRMPGTPANVHAAFAVLFWDFEERRISRSDFATRWGRLAKWPYAIGSADAWWEVLIRYAGERSDVIDLYELRRVLSRTRPPIAFTIPEAGRSGPILGTIHSSKGRESLQVELRLPPGSSNDGDLSEEARVLFVGATRARKTLKVGKGYWLQASSLKNGSQRVYRKLPDGGLIVEFGRDGDLDPGGQAGRSLFGSEKSLLESQARLAGMIGKITKITGKTTVRKTEDGDEYLYRLITEEDNTVIGHFGQKVGRDIFAVCSALHLSGFKPPAEIRHLYVIDVRTFALSPDDPILSSLRAPFNRSGMMLSPLVFAFPKIFLQRFRRHL